MSLPTDPDVRARLLSAMANGVAVIAGSDGDGFVRASAIAGLASYSIDPPSVVTSVPPALLPYLGSAFGVSLLAAGQHRIAEDLWEGPHHISTEDGRFTDDYGVEAALAAIVCDATLAEVILGRGVVIGRVRDVNLGRGTPLLAGGLGA